MQQQGQSVVFVTIVCKFFTPLHRISKWLKMASPSAAASRTEEFVRAVSIRRTRTNGHESFDNLTSMGPRAVCFEPVTYCVFEAWSRGKTPKKKDHCVAHPRDNEAKESSLTRQKQLPIRWFARRDGDGTDTEGDGDRDLAGDQPDNRFPVRSPTNSVLSPR